MKKVIMLFLIAAALPCWAVPQRINYQGYLSRPNGTPLDTTVAMTFRIYEISNGGNMVWMETHPAVDVNGGLFHVLLGSVTPLADLFSADRWLEIQVGTDMEMTPRQQIVSAAHAYRVGTVDGASGGTIGGNVNIVGETNLGFGNVNTGDSSFVTGLNNTSSGNQAVVSGGGGNVASGYGATVGGGMYNRARAYFAVVAGGGGMSLADSNSASGQASTIGGGYRNRAGGQNATISGGRLNEALSECATIGGGRSNSAIAGGGMNNEGPTVGGGCGNVAHGNYATVSGGYSNNATGMYGATVGGGANNTASEEEATVGGGYANTASNYYATVGGGGWNVASGIASTVGGGIWNHARGDFATVAGGGGEAAPDTNCAAGAYSMIPGGRQNWASGNYSLAAGRRARAIHGGSFVWADTSDANFNSWDFNTFNVRASGGYRLYSNAALTAGVSLAAGASGWTNISDSTLKRNRRNVDTEMILKKVAALPIQQWSYRAQDPSIEHVGPMAQDFWNAFHLGNEPLGISTVDADGVMMAAIQELAKRIETMQAENAALRERVQTLEADKQETLSKGR